MTGERIPMWLEYGIIRPSGKMKPMSLAVSVVPPALAISSYSSAVSFSG